MRLHLRPRAFAGMTATDKHLYPGHRVGKNFVPRLAKNPCSKTETCRAWLMEFQGAHKVLIAEETTAWPW